MAVPAHKGAADHPTLQRTGGVIGITTPHRLTAVRNPKAQINIIPGQSAWDLSEELEITSLSAGNPVLWRGYRISFHLTAILGHLEVVGLDLIPPAIGITAPFLRCDGQCPYPAQVGIAGCQEHQNEKAEYRPG